MSRIKKEENIHDQWNKFIYQRNSIKFPIIILQDDNDSNYFPDTAFLNIASISKSELLYYMTTMQIRMDIDDPDIPELNKYHGRTYSQWYHLLKMEYQIREQEEKQKRIKKLRKEIDGLETVEEKKARMIKELQGLENEMSALKAQDEQL